MAKFGSIAKLGVCVSLWGFANVSNVGWQSNFKKCEAMALSFLSVFQSFISFLIF